MIVEVFALIKMDNTTDFLPKIRLNAVKKKPSKYQHNWTMANLKKLYISYMEEKGRKKSNNDFFLYFCFFELAYQNVNNKQFIR